MVRDSLGEACTYPEILEEGIRPNAAVIAYAPWDNTNTIQRDPRCYFVPAVNPARIAGKLLELDLPFALHIFQGGEHGMSVCNRLSSYDERARERNRDNPNVALWAPLCVNWINGLFHIA